MTSHSTDLTEEHSGGAEELHEASPHEEEDDFTSHSTHEGADREGDEDADELAGALDLLRGVFG